jgi:fucose permease
VYIAPVNWIHVILALALMAIGLVMVFDALSSHDLEWPLGLFVLVVGVVWIIGAAILTIFLKPEDPPSADRTG